MQIFLELLPFGDFGEAENVELPPGGAEFGCRSRHIFEELVPFSQLLVGFVEIFFQVVFVSISVLRAVLHLHLEEGDGGSVCQKMVKLILLLNKAKEEPCEVVCHLFW